MRNALCAAAVAALVAFPALAAGENPPQPEREPAKQARPARAGSHVQHEKPASAQDTTGAQASAGTEVSTEAGRYPVPVPELPRGEILTRLRGKLRVAASTLYEGWPAQKAIDGDPKTSWFSASGDAAALKRRPWIEVTFPEAVTVQHVLALGNREPDWLVNYSIVVARIDLYDAKGARLASQGNETAVPTFDIEFHFKAPVARVRKLRFTSLADQGDKNPYRDIAIGELRAW